MLQTGNNCVNTTTFTGREWDEESGLYFFRARTYDPLVGRFLQVDPKSGKMEQPADLINVYLYANNDPILYKDPRGTSIHDDIFGTVFTIMFSMQLFSTGSVVAVFDPALGASMAAVGLQFSGMGLAANILVSGRIPTMVSYNGTYMVRNSAAPNLLNVSGFSLGAVGFIRARHGAFSAYNPSDDEEDVFMHEYGHYLQYKSLGGWSYVSEGWGEKGSTNPFEQDADKRASDYFQLPICSYHSPNHPVPACRF